MKKDTSGEKSDKHADKVEWSSTFISELMAHTVESLDIPRQYRNTKKMPVEDQEDWLKGLWRWNEVTRWSKVWKLVDLPPGWKTRKMSMGFYCKVRWTQKSTLGYQGLHSSLQNWFRGNLLIGRTVWNRTNRSWLGIPIGDMEYQCTTHEYNQPQILLALSCNWGLGYRVTRCQNHIPLWRAR